jgi:hypothetical protein
MDEACEKKSNLLKKGKSENLLWRLKRRKVTLQIKKFLPVNVKLAGKINLEKIDISN